MEKLPWTYTGRNRALLLVLAAAGLALFFAPWVHESAPELRVLSGYGLARLTGFFWAPAVAWFVLFPLVLTRRSVYKMRGARVAVAFLAGMALVTVGVLLAHPPRPRPSALCASIGQWGIYAAGGVALLAVVAAFGFGGRLDDIPTRQIRRGDETLHWGSALAGALDVGPRRRESTAEHLWRTILLSPALPATISPRGAPWARTTDARSPVELLPAARLKTLPLRATESPAITTRSTRGSRCRRPCSARPAGKRIARGARRPATPSRA